MSNVNNAFLNLFTVSTLPIRNGNMIPFLKLLKISPQLYCEYLTYKEWKQDDRFDLSG